MRTTIVIDDDVLAAERAIAPQRRETIGKIVSEMACDSSRPTAVLAERNGVPLLPVRKAGVTVTPAIENALRDEP